MSASFAEPQLNSGCVYPLWAGENSLAFISERGTSKIFAYAIKWNWTTGRCLFKVFKYFSFAYGWQWACAHVQKKLISLHTLKQSYAFSLDGWVSSRCIYQGVASIYGEPKWSLYFALGLSSPLWFLSSSGQHEWTEHCGCSGERELHLYFWERYPNFTPYKLQLLALPTYQYSFWSFHFHLDKFSCLSICFNFFMSVSTLGERKRLLWGRTSVRKEPSPLFSKGLALEPHSHPLCDCVGGS